jgi:hypothetical protein
MVRRPWLVPLYFLVLPVCFFLSAQTGGNGEEGPARVFRSNSLGMPLEEISGYRRDEFDFVLERYERDGAATAILYHKGRETASWDRTFGTGGILEREKEVRGDEVTERVFTQGILMEEIHTSPDGSVEKFVYSYRDGQVQEIRRVTGDDTVPETRLSYRVGPDGRLLGVSQGSDEEEERRTDYFFRKDGGYGEWHQREGQAEYYQFQDGRQVLQEQWQDRVLLERIVWTEEDGRFMRVREYPGEDRIVYELLDDDGRLLGQEERSSGGILYREFVYRDDNLFQMTERKPGEKLRYTYFYGPDGLTEERMERNDLLATRTLYLPEGRERRETYRRGILLTVVEYKDGIPQEADQ